MVKIMLPSWENLEECIGILETSNCYNLTYQILTKLKWIENNIFIIITIRYLCKNYNQKW